MANKAELYGIIAEFDDPDKLISAAKSARVAGYKKLDAYAPFPVHGLSDAIGFKDFRLLWLVFLGGIAGLLGGVAMQAYIMTLDYPMNIGGRPFNSWPSYVPVTFECTVLVAAFTAVIGMLVLNGLPRPYHSIFNAPNFDKASCDKFFLCIESDDPQFDRVKTSEFLKTLNPDNVAEVEA